MARAMIIVLLLMTLGFEPLLATDNPLAWFCRYNFPYRDSSTYGANLKLLSTMLSRIASSTRTTLAKGFVGTSEDHVYGVAIASACSSCITTAFHEALGLCGPRMGTHVLYEDCIVHISGKELIYNSSDVLSGLLIFTDTTQDRSYYYEPRPEYSDAGIDGNIKMLLQETAKHAAYNSTTMYATGGVYVNGTSPLLYSRAQCNLDLQPNDCWHCLDNIRSMARSFFYQQHGEWIAGTWCNFRYSTLKFYKGEHTKRIIWSDDVDPTTNMPAPKPAPGPVGVPRQKDDNKPIVVPSQKHKSKLSSQEREELVWGIGRSSEFKLFDFSQVSDATSNFSDENKLGQGGFGPV